MPKSARTRVIRGYLTTVPKEVKKLLGAEPFRGGCSQKYLFFGTREG
jgi:hypothetical protein